MTSLQSMNNAVKSYVEQYIAANRVDANSRDLTRLYATATTVGAVANLRADMLAQIPLVPHFRGAPLEVPSHPLVRMFQPGAATVDRTRRTELGLYFWGRDLVWKQRNAFRRVRSLRWVNPNVYALDSLMTTGLRGFRVYPSSRYQLEPVSYIDRADAVYVHEVDFDDDFEGVSDIERAFLEASIEPEMGQTVLAVFRNMAIPAMIVQPAADGARPSPDDVKTMQNFFQRMVRGALNAGKTVLSPGRWDVIKLQQVFKDMEMESIRKDARLSICVGSRVPLELIEPSAANYAQFEGARRAWAQAWVVPRIQWYASQLTEQLAHEWGADYSIEPDLEAVDFLKEDAATKIQTVSAKLGASLITIGAAQTEIGDKPDPLIADMYMVEGIPVPKAELPNLWKYRFQTAQLPGASPFAGGGNQPGAAPVAALATGSDTVPPVDGEKDDATSLCVMLSLAYNPDLLAFQQRLKTQFADVEVDWNAPAEFHVTLLAAPSSTPEQVDALKAALADIDLPALALAVGSLLSFDTLGKHALHFRVRRNPDLLELQETVYELCAAASLPISSYSAPGHYIPHITMGYATTRPAPLYFRGKLTVAPTALLLAVGDETVLTRPLEVTATGSKSRPARTHCMNCDAPPTKDVLWANGHGRAWFCDKHFVEWSEHGDGKGEIVSVHDITDGEVPVKFGGKSAAVETHVPDAQWKELKDWRSIAARKGADYAFTARALPRDVRDYLQVALADGDGDAAFADAETWLKASKSYADTRAGFVAEMLRVIGEGQKSEVSRAKFAGEMRSAVRRFGLMAFRDGMETEGVSPESFSADQLAAFRAWQDETSGYITGLGSELFREGGITETEVAARADAWADKSLRDVFYRGAVLAAPTKKKRWKRDPAKDSCADCIARDGQIKTLAEWREIGLPGDSRLACHGDHCGCTLEDAE